MTNQPWVWVFALWSLITGIGCRSMQASQTGANGSSMPAAAPGDAALAIVAHQPMFQAVYSDKGWTGPSVVLSQIDKDGRITAADYVRVNPCTTKGQTTTCKSPDYEFTLDRQNLVASLTGGQLSKAHPMRCQRGDGAAARVTCTEDSVVEKAGVALRAHGKETAVSYQVIYAEGGFAGNVANVDEVDAQGKVLTPNVDQLGDCQKNQKAVVCKGADLSFTWQRQEMTGQLTGPGLTRALPLTCASRNAPSLKVTCVPDSQMPP